MILLLGLAHAFTFEAPTEVAPGQQVEVVLGGAAAGVPVRLVVGGGGVGPGACPPALGGACLGVLGPTRMIKATTDASGEASFAFTLPAAMAPGDTLGLQLIVMDPTGMQISKAKGVDVIAAGVCDDLIDGWNDDPNSFAQAQMGGPDLWFAMSWVAPSTEAVGRLEVFTGNVTADSRVGLWTDAGGLPGAELSGGDFVVDPVVGFQGADLDTAVDVVGGQRYWVVWEAAYNGQATFDVAGPYVDYTASWDFGQTWGGVYGGPLKLRVLGCP